jgi:hypothetical protein
MAWHAYLRNGKQYLDVSARSSKSGAIVRLQRRASSDRSRPQQAQAEALEAGIIAGTFDPVEPEPATRLFADAIDRYLADAPRSAANIARMERLRKLLGHFPLSEIDQDTVNRLREDWLMERRYQIIGHHALRHGLPVPPKPEPAPATVMREIIVPIRAALMAAFRRDWCRMPNFHTLQTAGKRTYRLLPGEAERLIAASAPHLRPLFLFRLGTGARTGEALALDWQDVDLEGATAIFWADTTKAGKRRNVFLPPRVVAALAALPGPREGKVFRRPNGTPYVQKEGTGGQTDRGFAAALRRAGLDPKFRPHDLRHSFASMHYALHRDPMRLQIAGGWSSLKLVEIYVGLMPQGQEPAIRALLGLGERGFEASHDRAPELLQAVGV